MGLQGATPELVDTSKIDETVLGIERDKLLLLDSSHQITFCPSKHLVFHFRETLPYHPNGLRFSAFNSQGDIVASNEFFSVGGGFVVNEKTVKWADREHTPEEGGVENIFYKDSRFELPEPSRLVSKASLDAVTLNKSPPIKASKKSAGTNLSIKSDSKYISAALPFHNAASLLQVCQRENLTIAQVVFKNELQWRPDAEIKARTLNIWAVMHASIENGIKTSNATLPGGLNVKRRAPAIYQKLMSGLSFSGPNSHLSDTLVSRSSSPTSSSSLFPRTNPWILKRSLPALDWYDWRDILTHTLCRISLYAIAVNEENAAGGRVVTAPTNGAAGVLPAVIKYYLDFIHPHNPENDVVEMLLTASAIGMLYKRGASISAAEMGCQGEVGVACSMAAGALCSVLGGSVEQVENAAEIAMEHNLGLTCDPISGLVQIPCIERNALGAVKAVTAAQLAMHGDGVHRVSLDQVIETMRQTGMDMMSKYKETGQGGLAVNVPVC